MEKDSWIIEGVYYSWVQQSFEDADKIYVLDMPRYLYISRIVIRSIKRKLGIQKVLMVCDKDNIGSAKSIINNGGVLENEVEVDGVIEQRYWIENTK